MVPTHHATLASASRLKIGSYSLTGIVKSTIMHDQTPNHAISEHTTVGIIEGGMVADPAFAWAQVAGLVEVNDNGSWRLTEVGTAGLMQVLEQVVQQPPADGQKCAFARNRANATLC